MYLFAPCFLSLHSHSMTNVKRISSLHESSHSTRTKMVSRMAVIQTVSKLTDTHEPSCRVSVGHSIEESQVPSQQRGFMEAFTAPSHGHFRAFRSFSAEMQSGTFWISCWSVSRRGAKSVLVTLKAYVPIWWHSMTQFSFRDHSGLISISQTAIMLYLVPPAGCSQHGQGQGQARQSLLSLPPTFCLCCGCPPSSLSSVLAPFGRPIGHPGDRWWWVWDKDLQ